MGKYDFIDTKYFSLIPQNKFIENYVKHLLLRVHLEIEWDLQLPSDYIVDITVCVCKCRILQWALRMLKFQLCKFLFEPNDGDDIDLQMKLDYRSSTFFRNYINISMIYAFYVYTIIRYHDHLV